MYLNILGQNYQIKQVIFWVHGQKTRLLGLVLQSLSVEIIVLNKNMIVFNTYTGFKLK